MRLWPLSEQQANECEAEIRALDETAPEATAMRLLMQSLMPCGHAYGNLLTCDKPPFGCVICNAVRTTFQRVEVIRECARIARRAEVNDRLASEDLLAFVACLTPRNELKGKERDVSNLPEKRPCRECSGLSVHSRYCKFNVATWQHSPVLDSEREQERPREFFDAGFSRERVAETPPLCPECGHNEVGKHGKCIAIIQSATYAGLCGHRCPLPAQDSVDVPERILPCPEMPKLLTGDEWKSLSARSQRQINEYFSRVPSERDKAIRECAAIVCVYCADPVRWLPPVPDKYPGAGAGRLEHLHVSKQGEGRGCHAWKLLALIATPAPVDRAAEALHSFGVWYMTLGHMNPDALARLKEIIPADLLKQMAEADTATPASKKGGAQ